MNKIEAYGSVPQFMKLSFPNGHQIPLKLVVRKMLGQESIFFAIFFKKYEISSVLTKMGSLTHFLPKNVYNDVPWINGSKVTALNLFLQPQHLHYP